MSEVHPAYDMTARVWFLESGEEAGTLQSLLRMLPRGTVIAGYYPNGYAVSSADRGFCVNDQRDASYKARPKLSGPRMVAVQPTSEKGVETLRQYRTKQGLRGAKSFRKNADGSRLYDVNKILNWWLGGATIAEIAVALGPSARPDSVAAQMFLARRRGDSRAVRAYDPVRQANRLARLTGQAAA